MTWFYFHCVLAIVILITDYNGTSRGIYVALKGTKKRRSKKETNKFLINVMNGASKIFSPK